jgi:hypothetical protein
MPVGGGRLEVIQHVNRRIPEGPHFVNGEGTTELNPIKVVCWVTKSFRDFAGRFFWLTQTDYLYSL